MTKEEKQEMRSAIICLVEQKMILLNNIEADSMLRVSTQRAMVDSIARVIEKLHFLVKE